MKTTDVFNNSLIKKVILGGIALFIFNLILGITFSKAQSTDIAIDEAALQCAAARTSCAK